MKCISKIFFWVCFLTVYGDKVPDKIKRCHLKDSNLDECLRQVIQSAYEILGKGSINALNLMGIDPIVIDKLVIGAGTSAVHLEQHYENAKIFGFSKSKVSKVHLDWNKKMLDYETLIPQLEQKAIYDVNGKILVLPVYGKGDSTLTLYNVTLRHMMQFKEERKGGKVYLIVDTYKLNISVKGANYDLQNLFDGDEQLSKNILTVLNENWKEIFDDLRSGIEKVYAEVFKQVVNGLFTRLPYNEIFIE